VHWRWLAGTGRCSPNAKNNKTFSVFCKPRQPAEAKDQGGRAGAARKVKVAALV
jgi:hypothetical protein